MNLISFLVLAPTEANAQSWKGESLISGSGTVPNEVAWRRLTGAVKGSAWPGGKMRYIIEDNVPQTYRDKIKEAIDTLTADVGGAECVNLEEVTADSTEPYVTFRTEGARFCGTSKGEGVTEKAAAHTYFIYLNKQICFRNNLGAIQHEILHALGFIHTHQRPDRDDHVVIDLDKITEGRRAHSYDKLSADDIETYDIEYDVGSIMHYATGPSKPITTDSGVIGGQRSQLSPLDVEFVRTFYECTGPPPVYVEASTRAPPTTVLAWGGKLPGK